MNKKSNLFFVCLVGCFIALTYLSSFISSFIKFPFLGGQPIEIYLIFYVFSILLINKFYYKIFYFLITPFFLLLTPGLYFLNPVQVIVEYIATYYCFFLFLFFKFSKNEKKTKNILFFCLFWILSVTLKWTLHLLAGYFWWTENNFLASLILNSQYVYISFAIIFPLSIVLYFPLSKLNFVTYGN